MNQNIITCPHCHKEFSPDEVFTHKIDAAYKQKYDQEFKSKIDEMRQKDKEWKEAKEKEFEEEKKLENQKTTEKIKKELEEKNLVSLRELKEENERKDKIISEARQQEIELRREKNKLDEEKASFELDKQRQMDAERMKIKEETAAQVLKEHQMRDDEKNKQMDDMRKKIEELQQKANLTSQQLQGEVQELALEDDLKSEFPLDQILPVAKGVRGADVIQIVVDHKGKQCGKIIWESKRSKDWKAEWLVKLKENKGIANADVGIIVSTVLPRDTKHFDQVDGLIITNFESFLPLAKIVREKIIDLSKERMSSQGQDKKMVILYDYLRGNEFRYRVESIVGAFKILQEDLEKEKGIYAKIWAKREKQIQKVLDNTFGMYGDLQGLMGASLPELEMNEFEMIETTTTVVQTSITSVEES